MDLVLNRNHLRELFQLFVEYLERLLEFREPRRNENRIQDQAHGNQVTGCVTKSPAEIAAAYPSGSDPSNRKKKLVTRIAEMQNSDGSWNFNERLITDIGVDPYDVRANQPDGTSFELWMTTFIHSIYASKVTDRELEWQISDVKAKKYIVSRVKESPIMKEIREGNRASGPKEIDAVINHLVDKALKVLKEERTPNCEINLKKVDDMIIKENSRRTKREFHFVIDQSGSMIGEKIEEAKRCLIGLISGIEESCTFQIYGFGTVFDKFFNNGPQLYEDQNRDLRLAYINRMEANLGGTNLFLPLQDIFNVSLNQNVIRLIFVITDGCVDDLEGVVNLVAKNRIHNYVFSVGIGNDVCLNLVRRIAEKSSGRFVLVSKSESLLSNINNLLKLALEIDE